MSVFFSLFIINGSIVYGVEVRHVSNGSPLSSTTISWLQKCFLGKSNVKISKMWIVTASSLCPNAILVRGYDSCKNLSHNQQYTCIQVSGWHWLAVLGHMAIRYFPTKGLESKVWTFCLFGLPFAWMTSFERDRNARPRKTFRQLSHASSSREKHTQITLLRKLDEFTAFM